MALNLSTEIFSKMNADEFIREFHTFLPEELSTTHEEFEFLDHVVLHWLRDHPGIAASDVTEVIKLVNFCNDKYHFSIFRGETHRLLRVMINQLRVKNIHSRIFLINADRVREGKGVI